MNPVIKFTTLFGLLAVQLAVSLRQEKGAALAWGLPYCSVSYGHLFLAIVSTGCVSEPARRNRHALVASLPRNKARMVLAYGYASPIVFQHFDRNP